MEQVRKPVFAGSFYPGNSFELKKTVQKFISAHPAQIPCPFAIIAPHAGYVYSGDIAGCAYATLEQGRQSIRRVILFGPSHRLGFSGLALPVDYAFETPLGLVQIDQLAIRLLESSPFVKTMEEAHAEEHSLEVQLPFLQLSLENFKLIPLVVGDASAEQVCSVIETLTRDEPPGSTLVVVSSDLSHYLEYLEAKRVDERTSRAISELSLEDISSFGACGSRPIKGLLFYAQKHGLKAQVIQLANSGDAEGQTRGKVVGYGAYIFN